MIENIHKLWNECVDKTNDVVQCLELYTKSIKEDLFRDFENQLEKFILKFRDECASEEDIKEIVHSIKERHLSILQK